MKKVLLLNAGHTEMPMIDELRKMGCYIISSGNRPDFPGHALCDEYVRADYSNVDEVFEIVKDKCVDGIVSCAHDYGLVTASHIAEHMGWKGHDTVENTLLLHEKDRFKELCKKMGIRSPLSTCFMDLDEALLFAKNTEYPIIVKAADQASGVGINKAQDYNEAVSAINDAFNKSRKKKIVVEPYIEGQQESFVAFVVNKRVVSCMTCNCYSPINPYLIQTETMPSDNFDSLKKELIEITETLFDTLDLVDGIITLQYIVSNGKPYIIETMRRCLGNQFLLPVEKVTGFPWHKALVMSELGMDCSELRAALPEAKYAGHHAIMVTKNGKYLSTCVPDEIMDHVFKYVELFKTGQQVKNYLNERIGYIYYKFENRQIMDSFARTFNQNIQVNME